jgi:uncharacterized membrane protein
MTTDVAAGDPTPARRASADRRPLTGRDPLAMLRGTAIPRQGTTKMSKQVVVGIFSDEAAADTAAQALKDWDKLDDDVKLNAIGVLALGEDGKVKTQKLGKGAGIGVVLAAFTGPALIVGALAGGVLGALHHKNLGIDSAERDEITGALQDGKAAVAALVLDSQAAAVSDKLTELGGELHVLTPSDEAVAEVDAVAADAEKAENAESSAAPASGDAAPTDAAGTS